MAGRRGKAGFTLVELLVVMAIIGLLIALLLPALSAARSAARLVQCTNNLKQVALAIHSYHDSYNTLPVGSYASCWGTWQAAILPQLVGPNMDGKYYGGCKYDVPDGSGRYGGSRNLPVTTRSYPVLICPEDSVGTWGKITLHNYVVNYGSTGFFTGGAGTLDTIGPASQIGNVVFRGAPFSTVGGPNTPAKSYSLDEIADGLSNTLMVSEVIQGRKNDLRGLTWWGYAAGFSTYLAPNSASPDIMEAAYTCVNNGSNPPCSAPYTTTLPMMMAARSRHAQRGVNAAMCDGSVHFVANDIDVELWQALSSTHGNEAYATPF